MAAVAAVSACAPGATYGQEDLRRDVNAVRVAGAVGVQALVTTRDGRRLLATAGVADVRTGAPVPPNGHYRIGSNTKTFVATVVLQLAGEGRLSLDDAVERWLPGVVGGKGYDARRITLRHLLRHTSGIYDYNDDRRWNPFATRATFERRRFDHYAPEDLVAVAMRHPPRFPPGTERSYSNTNYVLAGMVIRRATGGTWQAQVRRRIIEPLRLTGTTMGDGVRIPGPHAEGYHQFEGDGPLVNATLLDPSAGDAGGAIISTPEDMTRFFTALLSGGLLRPAQLAEMKKTVPSGTGRYGLGLGWSPLPCGGGYWRHGGAVPGYLSAEGFTDRGERGAVVSMSTLRADGPAAAAQEQAAAKLIENALCES